MTALAQPFDRLRAGALLDRDVPHARLARVERARERLGVMPGRVDRLLQVQPEVHVREERVERPLVLLVAAGRPEREIRLAARRASVGESVVRGRLPGSSEFGSPSSSQNICARVPRQKPSSGITGAPQSQPPLGVADTMFP